MVLCHTGGRFCVVVVVGVGKAMYDDKFGDSHCEHQTVVLFLWRFVVQTKTHTAIMSPLQRFMIGVSKRLLAATVELI